MLIVDYDTFVRMPAGTIFAPYTPCVFEERFEIKVDHGHEYNGEWFFCGTMPLEPWFDQFDPPMSLGQWDTEMSTYDGDSNDASDYKMFAVLEKHEVERLIKALHWAMDGCPGDFETYKKSKSEENENAQN